jgi:DNA-binding XRE family transcriptional regulator
MDRNEFAKARIALGKTQMQMAELLRVSAKAVQSYEQGWRAIPAHVERQLLLLRSMKNDKKSAKACWKIKNCPPDTKAKCPAWEFNAGKLCWFINGTLCEGTVQRNWQAKMQICRSCEVMASILGPE